MNAPMLPPTMTPKLAAKTAPKADASTLVMAYQRSVYELKRMGWPAMLALAICAGALFVEYVAAADVEARISKARAEKNKLRAAAVKATTVATGSIDIDTLESTKVLDQIVADIHRSAQAHDVRLEQGEYRLQAEPGTSLARYRMLIPAKASYPQLRAWLDDIQIAHPGMLLDELSLRRENISSSAIEARINLSLLLNAK